MMTLLAQSLLRILLVIFIECNAMTGAASEKDLVNQLFADYNKDVKSTKDASTQTTVFLGFELANIGGIDEQSSTLTIYGWLNVVWKDEYLTWNTDNYPIDFIVVPAANVWKPELIVVNSVTNGNDLSLDDDYKFRVKIKPNGWVQWEPFVQWTISCSLDLTYFPIDQHTCTVTIINWMYRASFVNFTLGTSETDNRSIGTSHFSKSADWSLIKVFSGQGNVTGNIPFVSFCFVLQRVPTYFAVNIILPTVFLSILSSLVFRLPPEAGEKMGLSVTVLMSYSVILMIINGNAPRSDKLPIILYYVSTCFCINAISTAASILVLYIYHCESDNSLIVRWITYLFIRGPGKGNKVSSEQNWEASFAEKTKIFSLATEELNLDTNQPAARSEAQGAATAVSSDTTTIPTIPTTDTSSQVVQWFRQQKQEKMIGTMRRERLARIAMAVDNVLFYIISILTALLTIVCIALLIAYSFHRVQGQPIEGTIGVVEGS